MKGWTRKWQALQYPFIVALLELYSQFMCHINYNTIIIVARVQTDFNL